MKKHPKKYLLLLFPLFLAVFCFLTSSITSHAYESGDPEEIAEKLGDYDGKRFGVLTGGIHDSFIKEDFPNASLSYFSMVSDEVTALLSGTIDTFCCDVPSAMPILQENPSMTYLDVPLFTYETAFTFSKSQNGSVLQALMNEFLGKIRDDGTLETLKNKWISPDAGDYDIDMSGLSGNGKILTLATACSGKPISYYYNNRPTGYEVELVAMFCREYGYDLDIQVTDFASIIPGLVSEKYDIGADGFAVTEERKQSILFSDADYNADVVLMVKKDKILPSALSSAAFSGGEAENAGFFERLSESFEKTFIREARWKLIAEGVKTTLVISIFSAILGTVLGFGLCLLRRSGNRTVFNVTSVYIRLLQGTPLLVLLMILYYIVFAKTALSGEFVAVIAFALNFSAYVSEIFRSGIEGVDKGQREAALAIGYTAPEAFFKIVLPQAAERFLPVYKGEFISLVKMTSIVGYIAVQDLTKMSDIIRSRTYEAFFPLIATAVIYFILSSLFTGLLKMIEIRITPDRSKRKVKGVRLS